jgi:hypothetical protein
VNKQVANEDAPVEPVFKIDYSNGVRGALYLDNPENCGEVRELLAQYDFPVAISYATDCYVPELVVDATSYRGLNAIRTFIKSFVGDYQ